jgi:membrane protein YqaA with SNARE-associated domain
MVDSTLAALGLYGGTLVVCFVAGLVPLINAELFLAGLTVWVVKSPQQLLPIVALAAFGQMASKAILYFAGVGLLELPRGTWKARITQARSRIAGWQKRPYAVYALSASTGFPPLYLTTLAAGALRIRFVPFCLIGLAGRMLRFGIVVAIPYL